MKKLYEKCSEAIQKLTVEAGSAPLIELHGSGELLISGCRGILDYDPCLIKVETSCGVMTVKGKGLRVSVYRSDMLSVEGSVSMLCMGDGEDDT